ncbi:MAG TPA: hypothetical protein VFE17_03715 [Candidatus Baltobacteraceae bacterium]|jgi:ankyrin repeat protein|nr:hypothetical protein [Candidatus Baltobacteraceae bacterium]
MNYDALVRAAADGAEDTVRRILASPDAIPTNVQHEALSAACSSGHAPVVRALLSDDRFTAVSKPYETVLSPYIRLAVNANSDEVVQEFFRDSHLQTPKHASWRVIQAIEEAVESRRFDTAERLLAIPFEKGRPATVLTAIGSGDVQIVEMLLADKRFGAPSNLLQHAATTGNIDMVRAVLRSTAAVASLQKPLGYLQRCSPEIAWAILGDPRVTGDQIVYLIEQAALAGHEVFLGTLLSVRDDRIGPEQVQAFGSALLGASERGHAGAIRLLLHDDRWNPVAYNVMLNALCEATRAGHIDAVSAFLEDERIMNQPDHVAVNAALRYAVLNDNAVLIRKLLAVPGMGSSGESALNNLIVYQRIAALRDLLDDNTFRASPRTLMATLSGDNENCATLRLLLRDDRLHDDGNMAIQHAAQGSKCEAVLLLLAKHDNEEDRANAAQLARMRGTPAMSAYIDEVMQPKNGASLDALRALFALDPTRVDMKILWPLAQFAVAAGLDAATLRNLHRAGSLMPTLMEVFGPALSKSFAAVFHENLTALTRLSQVLSPQGGLSTAAPSDRQRQRTAHIIDEVSYVIAQITAGIPQKAADALWSYVCQVQTTALASLGKQTRSLQEPKERLLQHQSNILSLLCRDCADRLAAAAHAYSLPAPEPEPKPEVSLSRVINFRFGQLWTPAALEQLAVDHHPEVREAAIALMNVLQKFTAAAVQHDDTALDGLRRKVRECIDEIDNVLPRNGRTHPELASTLAAAKVLSSTPADRLFAPEVEASLVEAQNGLAQAQTRVAQGRPRGPQRTRDLDMHV